MSWDTGEDLCISILPCVDCVCYLRLGRGDRGATPSAFSKKSFHTWSRTICRGSLVTSPVSRTGSETETRALQDCTDSMAFLLSDQEKPNLKSTTSSTQMESQNAFWHSVSTKDAGKRPLPGLDDWAARLLGSRAENSPPALETESWVWVLVHLFLATWPWAPWLSAPPPHQQSGGFDDD